MPDPSSPSAPFTCPGCRTSLDLGGIPPGSWLACPTCQQPIEVPARVVRRATVDSAAGTWASAPPPPSLTDPVLDRREESVDMGRGMSAPPGSQPPDLVLPSSPAPPHPDLDPRKPWRQPQKRRLGCLTIAFIAVLGGIVQTMFVGGFLGLRNPSDLQLSWGFGFLMTAVTAWAVRSVVGATTPRDPFEF